MSKQTDLLNLTDAITVDGSNNVSLIGSIAAPSFVGNGSALVGLPIQMADSGWISLTPYLINSWVANSAAWSPRYRKIGDIVELWGLVRSGTATTALQLPAAIRPVSKNHMAGGASAGAYKLDVDSNGLVDVYASPSNWCSIGLMYSIN